MNERWLLFKNGSITKNVSGVSGGAVNINDNAVDTATTVATLNRDVTTQLNTDAEGNITATAVDSNGNNLAATIDEIFDAEKVAKEIQAQVEITQAFSQQAPIALTTFATDKTKPYKEATKALKDAKEKLAMQTDPSKQEQLQNTIIQSERIIAETQTDYDNWKQNGNYRIASNIIIAAIGGGASGTVGAVTKESLSWAADQMRQAAIEDSQKFPGICIGKTDCINNASGKSVGVNDDGVKVAGGRIVIETWCEKAGVGACERDTSTRSGWKENANGTVIFKPKDANDNNLTISQFIDQHQELRSELRGVQGGAGQMKLLGLQFEYAAGSFWDKLAEAYSGTHDSLNSFIWYDELGNGKKLDSTIIAKVGNTTNSTNVILATPFAYSVLLPPEIWNVVFSVMKSK